MAKYAPPNVPLPVGVSGPSPNTRFLGPPRVHPQMASRLVQLFSHSSCSLTTDIHTDRPRYLGNNRPHCYAQRRGQIIITRVYKTVPDLDAFRLFGQTGPPSSEREKKQFSWFVQTFSRYNRTASLNGRKWKRKEAKATTNIFGMCVPKT